MHGGVNARVRLAERGRRVVVLQARGGPPLSLRMGSVTFGKIPEGEGVLCEGVLCEGGFVGGLRQDVGAFRAEEGLLRFEDCDFGTSSDARLGPKTVRIGVVAMQRMLLTSYQLQL